MTLTVSTGANTPTGTFSITINGTTVGGPTRTQSLSITVKAGSTSSQDFTLAISNPSLTLNPNEPATFNGTATALGGYSSMVSLSCAGDVPIGCTASPLKLTPTISGAAFTITTTSDVEKNYSFNIVATGNDAAHTNHSATVQLIVGFNFALDNNSPAQAVQAGQTASYNLDAVPLGNGSIFPTDVSLSCSSSGLPPLSTCAFTPNQVPSGSGDTNVLLNIATTAAVATSARLGRAPGSSWYVTGLLLPGIVLAFAGLKKTEWRRRKMALPLAVSIVLISILVACGGGSSANVAGGAGHPGTPPGNYTITVNGIVGSVTRSAQVVLTVQ